MARAGERWTKRQIDDEKARIKTAVDATVAERGAPAALKQVQSAIARLGESSDPGVDLERFICIVYALLLHEQCGKLSKSQVRQLVDLGHAILQVNQVAPIQSRLSFLYGDLHQVLSQIRRRDGEIWLAAWEQQMGNHLAQRGPSGGRAFQALALAMRALRIGEAPMALSQLDLAESGELPPASRHQAAIMRVTALRLSAQRDEARDRLAQELARDDLPPKFARELEWEKLCIGAQETLDLEPLMRATKKGGTHGQASYVLEARLWAHAVPTMRWLESLQSFANLARRPHLELFAHRVASLAYVTRGLGHCYDDETPITVRLRGLGDALGSVQQLYTVDKELLAWLGATRWLSRHNYLEMAALTCGEYIALSRRLSDGSCSDVLGLAGDLLEKPWLNQLRRSP